MILMIITDRFYKAFFSAAHFCTECRVICVSIIHGLYYGLKDLSHAHAVSFFFYCFLLLLQSLSLLLLLSLSLSFSSPSSSFFFFVFFILYSFLSCAYIRELSSTVQLPVS